MPAVCAHCGLPLRGARVSLGQGPERLRFCCRGCRVAHQALAAARADRDALIAAEVDESPATPGREGSIQEWSFQVEGMVCWACAPIVRRVLEKTGGVFESRVNFITGRVTVRHDTGKAGRGRIRDRLARYGYRVVETGERAAAERNSTILIRISLGLFLAVDVMMLSLPEYLHAFAPGEEGPARLLRVAMALLCLPILLGAARPVFARAGAALVTLTLDLNFMVALGTASAYGYSLYGLITGGPRVYFETAAFLPVLIMVGQAVEEREVLKAREALTGLSDELPELARVIRAGREEDAPPEDLHQGDLVIVSGPGRLPGDGTVREGELVLDESLVSGESGTRRRAVGDVVRAGMKCLAGRAVIEIAAPLEESLLADVISSLERAELFRGPRQMALDRVVRVMAPGVVALALAAFLVPALAGAGLETGLLRALAVTLFACPCALGLAAPLARAAAVSFAAGRGIITRDAEALETAGRPDVLVLDKTGTLTRGTPELIRTVIAPDTDMNENEVLAAAAALEQESTHPLAEAVRSRAGAKTGEPAQALSETPGMGTAGRVFGREWMFGGERMMAGGGAALPQWADTAMTAFRERGASVSFLAVKPSASGTFGEEGLRPDGWNIAAVFGFDDVARDDLAGTVSHLQGLGIRIIMATGDHRDAADKVARALAITDVRAGLTPEQKRGLVLELRKDGRVVWFAGDGINDAPALAVADLGIAMGRGAKIAAQAGAVILAEENLARLPEIIALADRLSRVVRQNLAWAVAYNLIGLPLAFLGMLSPVLSALAMMASSISVTLNSTRLRSGPAGWSPPPYSANIKGGEAKP